MSGIKSLQVTEFGKDAPPKSKLILQFILFLQKFR